jgi:hypothetical protein
MFRAPELSCASGYGRGMDGWGPASWNPAGDEPPAIRGGDRDVGGTWEGCCHRPLLLVAHESSASPRQGGICFHAFFGQPASPSRGLRGRMTISLGGFPGPRSGRGSNAPLSGCALVWRSDGGRACGSAREDDGAVESGRTPHTRWSCRRTGISSGTACFGQPTVTGMPSLKREGSAVASRPPRKGRTGVAGISRRVTRSAGALSSLDTDGSSMGSAAMQRHCRGITRAVS